MTTVQTGLTGRKPRPIWVFFSAFATFGFRHYTEAQMLPTCIRTRDLTYIGRPKYFMQPLAEVSRELATHKDLKLAAKRSQTQTMVQNIKD